MRALTWIVFLISIVFLFRWCGGDDSDSAAEDTASEAAAKAPAWVGTPAEGAAPLPAEVKGQWNFMGERSTPNKVTIGGGIIQGTFGYSTRNFANIKAVKGSAGPIPADWQGIWFPEERNNNPLFVSSAAIVGTFSYSEKHYRFLEGSHANDVVTITGGSEDDDTVKGSIELLEGAMIVSLTETSKRGRSDTVAGKFVRKGHSGPKEQGTVLRVVEGSMDDQKVHGQVEQVGSNLMVTLVSQRRSRFDAYGGMVTKKAKKAYVRAFGGMQLEIGNLGESLFHTHAFDVPAIIALIQEGKYKDLADLEKIINDPESGINNVDLDQDGKVDLIGIDESRSGKSIVLSFMGFPSSTPQDKSSKTVVAEITIRPEGTAKAQVKAPDGTVVEAPKKMVVSGLYPDYAKGSENAAYESSWDMGDTALLAGGVGSGLLLYHLFAPNRPMYGGFGYGHYRNRGYNSFRHVDGPSSFFNRRSRFRSGMDWDDDWGDDDDDDDGGDSKKKKKIKKLKKKNKKLKKKNKKLSKLVKKHKKKAAKAKKQAKKQAKKAKRARARSVRKSSRSRGSRRGK